MAYLNFYNATLDKLNVDGLGAFCRYVRSDDVQQLLNQDPRDLDYARASSLYDTLIQTLANNGQQQHPLFDALLSRLMLLTHEHRQQHGEHALKDVAFQRQKLETLFDVLQAYTENRLQSPPLPDDCVVGALSFQLLGTGHHSLRQQLNTVDAMAQQLPCMTLLFNGPSKLNNDDPPRAFAVESTASAVHAVTDWLANKKPKAVSAVHVDGFSRGGFAAACSVNRIGALTQDNQWQLFSSQYDPVAMEVNPTQGVIDHDHDHEATRVPDHAEVVQFRSAHETRPIIRPFGGHHMRHVSQVDSYSPFRPSTQDRLPVRTIMLGGKHNTVTTRRRVAAAASDDEQSMAAANNTSGDIALSYAVEQYQRSGVLSRARETTFSMPVCSSQRHQPSPPMRVTISHDPQQRRLQRLEQYSHMMRASEAGHLDFKALQKIQHKPDAMMTYGSHAATRKSRYEAQCIGRYGVGPVRFANAEHFETFVDEYPNVAKLVNPEDAANLQCDRESPDLQLEFERLHQQCQQSQDPHLQALYRQAQEQLLILQKAGSDPMVSAKQDFMMLKAELSRACQLYIHTNWSKRDQWFFPDHGNSGIKRAIKLDRRIQQARNKADLLTIVDEALGKKSSGNWNKNSLKTHLYVMVCRLDKVQQQKHRETLFISKDLKATCFKQKYDQSYHQGTGNKPVEPGAAACGASSPRWTNSTCADKPPCPDAMKTYHDEAFSTQLLQRSARANVDEPRMSSS